MNQLSTVSSLDTASVDLSVLIMLYQIYLDTTVHAPLCSNIRKEETNEEVIDSSITTNTCTTSTSR